MKRVTYIVNRRPRATANVVAEYEYPNGNYEYVLDNGKELLVRPVHNGRDEIITRVKTKLHYGWCDRVRVVGNIIDIEEAA